MFNGRAGAWHAQGWRGGSWGRKRREIGREGRGRGRRKEKEEEEEEEEATPTKDN